MFAIVHKRIRLVDSFGSHIDTTINRLFIVVLSRRGMPFFVLCALLLHLMDPAAFGASFSAGIALVLYMAMTAVAVATFLFVLAGLRALFGPSLPRLPTLCLSLPIAMLAALGGQVIVLIFAASPTNIFTTMNVVQFLVLAILYDSLFFIYAYPDYARRHFARPQTAEPRPAATTPVPEITARPECREVIIGSDRFGLHEILMLEAREHHVEITLDGRSMTRRARLGDIIAQTREDEGVQPHRSFWVARRAIGPVRREGSRHIMVLANGQTVPIARTRLDTVRAWIDCHAGDQLEQR